IELFEDYVLGASILLTEWLAAVKRQRWIPATIGARLALVRNALGVSQADFCTEAGIDLASYQRWESGEAEPPIELALKLFEHWELALDFLYRGQPGRLRSDLVDKMRGESVEGPRRRLRLSARMCWPTRGA